MHRTGFWLVALVIIAIGTPANGQEPVCTSDLPPCTLPSDGTPAPGVIAGCVTGSPPCAARNWVYDGHNLPPMVLSFTYDDGPTRPSAEASVELAQYLRSQGIRATFFVATGPHTGLYPFPPWGPPCPGNTLWGQGSHPDTPDLTALAKIEQLGHRIASHTHNHFPLDDRIHSQIVPQVCTAQGLLDPYVPDNIFLMRPPYGGWSTGTADLIRAVESLNKITGPVLWSHSSDDWICSDAEPPTQTIPPEQCAQILLGRPDLPLGGAVLFHDRLLNTPNGRESAACPPNTQGTWSLRLAQTVVPVLRDRKYLILPIEADPAFPGGMLFTQKATWSTNDYGDAGGWGDVPGYYGTFRSGDVNGDGKADVCARGCCAVVCSLSNGTQFGAVAGWQGLFSNANGWVPPERSTTIQLGDVNNDGKDDLCALEIDGIGQDGVICTISNGTSFGAPTYWLPASSLPAVIDDDPGYYGTIRLAKVVGGNKGKDLCFRAPDGIRCAVNQGTSFATPTLWSPFFSDTAGWKPVFYSSTMQFGDLDGDNVADACARGAAGVYCGLSNGSGFQNVQQWSIGSNFSNADFLPLDSSTRYTATFRLADVDGDKRADACIRSAAGFLCAQSLGNGFDVYRVWQKKDFRDDQGWSPDKYAMTTMLADTTGDGRADVCVRGPDGIFCAPSDWCAGCTKYNGTLAGAGASQIQPNETQYTAGAGIHVAAMAGPTGTDYNLELEKWNGVAWTTVVLSPGPTSPERITYRGTAGTYRWKVTSASGSGPYAFWLKAP